MHVIRGYISDKKVCNCYTCMHVAFISILVLVYMLSAAFRSSDAVSYSYGGHTVGNDVYEIRVVVIFRATFNRSKLFQSRDQCAPHSGSVFTNQSRTQVFRVGIQVVRRELYLSRNDGIVLLKSYVSTTYAACTKSMITRVIP